jgi:outer membrane protein TolC
MRARAAVPATALAALLLALSGAAAAGAAPLTLQEAQRQAVERSRLLASKDFAASAARELAVAAGRLPDPILKVGVDNLPVEGPDKFSLGRDFMTMRRVGIMQDLTRADKRALRAERFEREAQKSGAEKTAAIAAIERDTALAWLDRFYAEAMAVAVAEEADQAKLEIQAAEAAYRAGRGNQADIFMARSALAMIDDRASELRRRATTARITLARWIGEAAELPLAGKPATDAIGLDPDTLHTQLGQHPEIAVLVKQEEIAATEAKLARANQTADWSVELAFQQRGPAYANMLSVGVSVPLQWDRQHRQDRELSARLAQVEQARAEREDMLQAHVAQVRTMMNEWQNDRERHARYGRELLPLAESRTTATLAAYRGGKASLADMLAARRSVIEVRLQALQLEAESARLWAQLNFLLPEAAHSAGPTMRTMKNQHEK